MPEASTAVATTVTLPKSAQETVAGLMVKLGLVVQLSEAEPMLDTLKVAEPVALSVTTYGVAFTAMVGAI